MHWYVDVLKKYAVFTGRARRQEFWMFVLINMLINIGIGIFEGVIGAAANTDFTAISSLYSLAILVPLIAVGVRRLHDTDRSGWWILLGIIPLVNIALIVLFALDGTPGPNQYGPDPKGAGSAFGYPAVPGYAAPPVPPAPPAPPVAAQPALPAAGWLPDPTTRYGLRYWDGARWTEHVSTDGVTGTDPL